MYLFLFSISCVLCWIATRIVRYVALRYDITDKPVGERKIHTKPIPLLGGVGIFISLCTVIILYRYLSPASWPAIFDTHVLPRHLFGILSAGLILIIGGALDDAYNLRPRYQIIWPILAALTIIASGIGVEKLTNPFGGYIILSEPKWLLFYWHGIPRYFTLWSDTLTFFWLMTIIYTTKFLDGLDGLVSGMTVINSAIILALSVFFFVNIPTALIAAIVAGVFFGFLIWNFHPAKIFLGEAGSTLAGFLLGVLAIISGAKVATTVLILGIPILDGAWVIFQRICIDRRSPFQADKKHIHFRLLSAGFSQRQAVSILYLLAVIFGGTALFLQSIQKMYLLFGLFIAMAILMGILVKGPKNGDMGTKNTG